MAVAEIIGAAVGVLLLIIVAYVVLTGTLMAAETVTAAQKDITLQNEARMKTSISLSKSDISYTEILPTTDPKKYTFSISVENTGNEMITHLEHMDLFTDTRGATDEFRRLTYSSTCIDDETVWCIDSVKKIAPGIIHPNQLDPGEKMWVTIKTTGIPAWFQATTGNGVNAQTTYP
jgi:flagellar protein FlaF